MFYAYMYGLGGAEKGEKLKNVLVFKAFLKGSKEPRVRQEK
jgi:hypothetical protein